MLSIRSYLLRGGDARIDIFLHAFDRFVQRQFTGKDLRETIACGVEEDGVVLVCLKVIGQGCKLANLARKDIERGH